SAGPTACEALRERRRTRRSEAPTPTRPRERGREPLARASPPRGRAGEVSAREDRRAEERAQLGDDLRPGARWAERTIDPRVGADVDAPRRVEHAPQDVLGALAVRAEAPDGLLAHVVEVGVVTPDEKAGEPLLGEECAEARQERACLLPLVDDHVG